MGKSKKSITKTPYLSCDDSWREDTQKLKEKEKKVYNKEKKKKVSLLKTKNKKQSLKARFKYNAI